MTHFVIRGVVFLRGWGRVSTGAVRAIAAVTLTVQAESDEEEEGGGDKVRGQPQTKSIDIFQRSVLI